MPREIVAPRPRHATPRAGTADPHWGERELIALAVLDGSIRRAEAIAATLHSRGFDIARVSGSLAALRSLRGDIAYAFREHQTDLLIRLHADTGARFEALCRSLCSLSRGTAKNPAPGYRRPDPAAPVSGISMPDAAECIHALGQGQHA